MLCSQAGKISPEIYEEFLDLSYRNEQVELGKAEPAEIAVDISLMATALEHYGKFENYDKDLARRLFSIVRIPCIAEYTAEFTAEMKLEYLMLTETSVQFEFIFLDERLRSEMWHLSPSGPCSIQPQL